MGPASGIHSPAAPEPNVHPMIVRLSCPSASIASAAKFPTSIPVSLGLPFAIPWSDVS
jgi:hypothetical protein